MTQPNGRGLDSSLLWAWKFIYSRRKPYRQSLIVGRLGRKKDQNIVTEPIAWPRIPP